MKPSGPDDDSSTKTHQNHVPDRSSSLDSHSSDGINGNEPEQARDSFGWISSRGSLRSHSLSFSRGVTPQQILDEIESASVSQAGDIGDRTLHSNRCSESDSLQFSVDDAVMQNENSFPEKVLLPSYGFWFRSDTTSVGVSPLSPLPSELVSPISTDAILDAKDKNQIRSVSPVQDNKISLPLWIEYVSYLVHLAVFGILGAEPWKKRTKKSEAKKRKEKHNRNHWWRMKKNG